MSGIDRIAAERLRQLERECYSAAHDDERNDAGELAIAAACYAAYSAGLPLYKERRCSGIVEFRDPWPWQDEYDKRGPDADRIGLLVKAGALIAAEIDRLERRTKKVPR